MNVSYAILMCLLLCWCKERSDAVPKQEVESPSDKAKQLQYRTIHYGEPVSIDLEKQTIVNSDYEVASDFCGVTGTFCVTSPLVSAAYSSVAQLAEAASTEGWELQQEQVTASRTLVHVQFLSPDKKYIWQSTYSIGNEYPISILYMRSKSVDPDQPILSGLILE